MKIFDTYRFELTEQELKDSSSQSSGCRCSFLAYNNLNRCRRFSLLSRQAVDRQPVPSLVYIAWLTLASDVLIMFFFEFYIRKCLLTFYYLYIHRRTSLTILPVGEPQTGLGCKMDLLWDHFTSYEAYWNNK